MSSQFHEPIQFQENDFVGPGDIEMLRRILSDYCDERGLSRSEASVEAARLIHLFQDGMRCEEKLRAVLNRRSVPQSAA